jgi:hypothetical protein
VYLLDTNIFLEVLLDREYSGVIQKFLNRDPDTSFFITDFSLYSIGIFLTRKKQPDHFGQFLNDLEQRGIQVLSLTFPELARVAGASRQYDLDFDDAYQYVAADENKLKLVSIDHDFDRIPGLRIHPKDL